MLSSSVSSCSSAFLYHTTKAWSLYQSAAIPSMYPPAISIHLLGCQLFALAILSKFSIHAFGSSLSLPQNCFGLEWLLSRPSPRMVALMPLIIRSNCSSFITISSSGSSEFSGCVSLGCRNRHLGICVGRVTLWVLCVGVTSGLTIFVLFTPV